MITGVTCTVIGLVYLIGSLLLYRRSNARDCETCHTFMLLCIIGGVIMTAFGAALIVTYA